MKEDGKKEGRKEDGKNKSQRSNRLDIQNLITGNDYFLLKWFMTKN